VSEAATAKPDWPQRVSLRLQHFDPSLLLFGAVGLALIMLVVNPLARLVVTGFTPNEGGGAFTLDSYLVA
jgi:hypothetical protein